MIIKEQEIRMSNSDGYMVTKSNDEDRYIVLRGRAEFNAWRPYLSVLNKNGTIEIELVDVKIIISNSKIKIINDSW